MYFHGRAANIPLFFSPLLKRGRLSRGSECLFFLYGNDNANLISVSFLPASVPAGLSSPKSPSLSRSGFSPFPNPCRPTHNCSARPLRLLASDAAHCARRFASAVQASVRAPVPTVGLEFLGVTAQPL